MEPSNRTRRSRRFWGRNPRAVQDDIGFDPAAPPPPQQVQPDCLELDPAGASPQPDCLELEAAGASLLPHCLEFEATGAPLLPYCLELHCLELQEVEEASFLHHCLELQEAEEASPLPHCLELREAEEASPLPHCLELQEAEEASPLPHCLELQEAGASPSSTPQQAQPDCFELDPTGAPFPSPPSPPSIVLHPAPVCVDQSRFELLSLLDRDEELPSASDSSGGHGAENNDGIKSGEGAVVRQHSSNSDSDDDEDPFLTDRFGKLTTRRLSDMEAAFEKHLENEASKPKVEEKKYSKEEILKQNADRKKRFMEYALQKYNSEEDLAGELRFVFDEIIKEVYVIEEGMKFYEHFNFTAKQAGSTVLFFAEVVPHGDTCDVLCCKLLDCNDNGHCFGCKNQGSVNLRHPADESLYVGGHEDCEFPFMWDSITDSEDDSD